MRHAVRKLRRSPGFAIAAILILAIGIAANTAMFSVLNALVLRSLSIANPETLFGVSAVNARGQLRLTLVTALDELARERQPLTDLCAYSGAPILAVEANGTPSQVLTEFITANCLRTFGVQPIIGRGFTDDEAPTSGRGQNVVLLGYRYWQRAFGGDVNAVGRTIKSEGTVATIVGVLPPSFTGLQVDYSVGMVAPFGTIATTARNRPPGATYILGRLRDEVTMEQARAELAAKWPALLDRVLPSTLSEVERTDLRDVTVKLEPLGKGFSGLRLLYRQPLTTVFALTGALLLLACVNLSGLLLSRLAARQSELAVRRALGATRARLARELFAESATIAAAGAVLAVPLAWAVIGPLQSLLPIFLIERTISLSPDWRVLLATGAAAAGCAIVMQILPLWIAARADRGVATQWNRTIASHSTVWSKSLVVVQVAVSIVLLVGAALLVRSLSRLLGADTGIVSHNVLTARIMPVPGGYVGFDPAAYYPQLVDRLSALPGVRSVSYTRVFPARVDDTVGRQPVAFVGSPNEAALAVFDVASPDFFATVGIPLLRGRLTAWTDTSATAAVAVISESLARALSPDGDVLGRHIRYGNDRTRQDMEIVGVVANATQGSFRSQPPTIYRPPLQEGAFGYYPTFHIAAAGDPLALAEQIRSVVAAGGREYVHELVPLQQRLERSAASERLTATLAAAIAAIAVLLALIGVYSLLAYAVARRTRELGVRVALGASQHDLLRMVVREGVILTAIGIAIGIPAAVMVTKLLQRLLYGISTTDAVTLSGSAGVFLVLGAAAGLLPALRATRVDPVIALRSE